jgi:hypothetical protein
MKGKKVIGIHTTVKAKYIRQMKSYMVNIVKTGFSHYVVVPVKRTFGIRFKIEVGEIWSNRFYVLNNTIYTIWFSL